MRVNHKEQLTCITRINDVTRDGGTIRVEPLRNFPLLGDLVVDMGSLYRLMDEAECSQVAPLGSQPPSAKDSHTIHPPKRLPDDESAMQRLVDCIECG